MIATCKDDVELRELVDYLAADLPRDREAALEDHFFSCPACTERLVAIEQLGSGVRDLMAAGTISSMATRELLSRAVSAGLKLREYTLEPGRPVDCTAMPEDDLVVVRLLGDFRGAGLAGEAVKLEIEPIDLEGDADLGGSRSVDAVVDQASNELVLLFAGDRIRTYPRSRWTMRVRKSGADATTLGPYVMKHTPWQQLTEV